MMNCLKYLSKLRETMLVSRSHQTYRPGRRSEAANTEREQDPASGVAGLAGVVTELLADLTVDLVPELGPQQPVT